ncbi:response regulator [Spirulina subsalsa FACHB-351]|uniref:histidine kinase n=1 Tax=Spirulina subsalsa FACHB-351 TaxID=234711 RepID=A0ABT3LA84_9CYAN|nr:response regulator [Spirulina subsalsa]MCW6038423.1 response regulator [Spirulina subsalsa FACHB-351]
MFKKIPLHLIVTLQFVIQMLVVVGLVGYFSYRSGQEVVRELAHEWMNTTANKLKAELDQFLGDALLLLATNQGLIERQQLNAEDFGELEAHFVQMLKLYPGLTAISFYNPQSQMIGVANDRSGLLTTPETMIVLEKAEPGPSEGRFYRLSEEGERLDLIGRIPNWNPTQRSWYAQALQQDQPDWTSISALVVAPLPAILAVNPIKQGEEIRGIITITLILNDISQFLAQLHLSPQGQVFILETSGELVATSTNEIVAPITRKDNQNVLTRLAVTESQNPLTQAVGEALLSQSQEIKPGQSFNFQFSAAVPGVEYQGVFKVKGERQRFFVNVTSYQNGQSLNWQIVSVIPESDLMGTIYGNLRRTLLLGGVALGIAVASSLWIARRITRSLSHLTEASENFMTQRREQAIQQTRIAEIAALSQSLQAMMLTIQEGDILRQNYTHDLEQQVALKTIALTEAQKLAHMGSWEVDPTENTVTWSKEVYRIHEAEDYPPTTRPDREIVKIHPQDQEHYQKNVIEAIRAGQSFDTDVQIITHKGNVRFIHVQGQPIYNEAGEMLKIIGTTTDITARKQAEQALIQAKEAAEAANQAKSIFLANMSHELRTPLNAILGYPRLLLNSSTISPEDRSYIRTIERSGEYLLALINQILDLSKIEAGRMVLNVTTLKLHQLLHEIEIMLQPSAQAKGLTFTLEKGDNLPDLIETDGVKLQQVLVNLLNNAIKFTHQGTVHLRAVPCREDDHPSASPYLKFTVQDTGVGIAVEELQTLFQAFVQTESGRNSQTGTGLGLVLSQKLVALMGGELQVESEVGKGTNFSFTLPLSRSRHEDSPDLESDPIKWRLAPQEPAYRILVADDVAENREVLVKRLELWGFKVFEAQDGEEAIAQTAQHHPDLIFMDIRMPKLNGIEASQKIQQTLTPPIPKIIALTASAFEEDRTEILASGCDDFIRKPFQEQEILSCLAHHLKVQFIQQPSEGVSPSGEGISPTQGMEDAPTLRILIAEDNLINQKVLLLNLKALGYTADVAANGLEVLEHLSVNPYDLILMDVQMPEMDGITATQIIRRDFPQMLQPYIIALTANDEASDRLTCAQAGMNGYLTKPLGQDQLAQAVCSCASARRLSYS